MKFVLFKKSLEEGAQPIYLFDGEEEYFKERGEAMLKEKFLGEPSLNYTVFQGESLKGSGGKFPFHERKAHRQGDRFLSLRKRFRTISAQVF